MAQTGFTPIQIYSSSTAAAAPVAGSLANSTLGSELAINITDGKLFYKDNANAIQVIGWKVVPATAGGTGQTSYTQGDLLYATSSTTLGRLANVVTGNALISGGVGGDPAWGKIGLTTHVSGTLPVTNGGTGTATAFTAGSVVFSGASGVFSQNNANFFWDNTNARLGIGNAAPATRVHLTQPDNTSPAIRITNSSGRSNELGYTGQFEFSLGANFTNDNVRYGVFTAGGGVATIWTNGLERVRVFSTGGFSIGNTTDPGATNLSVTGTGQFGTTVGVGAATPATSGAGITFPATQSASTDVNTLDDYEEGTWTTTISGSSTAGSGISYDSRRAEYVKIGRLVTVQVQINIGLVGTSPTGDLIVTGLPFTPTNPGGGSLGNGLYTGSANMDRIDFPASTTSLCAQVYGGDTNIYIVATGSNVASARVQANNLATDDNVQVSVTYMTAT
jgi:hypothetical protein